MCRDQHKGRHKGFRSRYHLFLREQLGKMTEVDRKNECSIVSGMWKKIKEDPGRLVAYNNTAQQMRYETEKSPVGCMVAERPAVKK